MQLSRNEQTKTSTCESVQKLVFYNFTFIFLFSQYQPKHFSATDHPTSLIINSSKITPNSSVQKADVKGRMGKGAKYGIMLAQYGKSLGLIV